MTMPSDEGDAHGTPAVTLRAMTASEYEAWIGGALQSFAEERAAAVGIPLDVSLTRARVQLTGLLPEAHATPGMSLLVILDADGNDVGRMWLGADPDRADTLFVWDISIDPKFRGAGLGRAAMTAAEGLARQAGHASMSLNVFGPNAVARRLYDSLGYRATSVQMVKSLEEPRS
jgi:ribosomal protein S18 acetylase RimI-like enzyme